MRPEDKGTPISPKNRLFCTNLDFFPLIDDCPLANQSVWHPMSCVANKSPPSQKCASLHSSNEFRSVARNFLRVRAPPKRSKLLDRAWPKPSIVIVGERKNLASWEHMNEYSVSHPKVGNIALCCDSCNAGRGPKGLRNGSIPNAARTIIWAGTPSLLLYEGI